MADKRIQAVIFDSDGTMLDTREIIFQGYEHTLRTYGYPVPPRSELATYMGHTMLDCYRIFAPGADIAVLSQEHHDFQERSYHLVSAYDGLLAVMQTLIDRGIRIGVCSSRGRNLASLLKYAGAHDFCEVIISRDDVANHKPHPEGVLKALATLGVNPAEAIMVGDMPFDIEAGKAAGVAFTVGITHGFSTREVLENAGADHVVDSLKDVVALVR